MWVNYPVELRPRPLIRKAGMRLTGRRKTREQEEKKKTDAFHGGSGSSL